MKFRLYCQASTRKDHLERTMKPIFVPTSSRRAQDLRAWLMVGICLLACLGGAGCNPYSEIRGQLSKSDQARFDRGTRAATPCWTCHDLTGEGQKIGPPLTGLFGQKAGFVKGFPYSPAMLGSPVVWTRQSLNRFLLNSQALIPGNRMLSPPLPDPRMRSDLIFFLDLVTRPALVRPAE